MTGVRVERSPSLVEQRTLDNLRRPIEPAIDVRQFLGGLAIHHNSTESHVAVDQEGHGRRESARIEAAGRSGQVKHPASDTCPTLLNVVTVHVAGPARPREGPRPYRHI